MLEENVTGVIYFAAGGLNNTSLRLQTAAFGGIAWTNGYKYSFTFQYQV